MECVRGVRLVYRSHSSACRAVCPTSTASPHLRSVHHTLPSLPSSLCVDCVLQWGQWLEGFQELVRLAASFLEWLQDVQVIIMTCLN